MIQFLNQKLTDIFIWKGNHSMRATSLNETELAQAISVNTLPHSQMPNPKSKCLIICGTWTVY